MRFKHKPTYYPYPDEKRIVFKFLWFPRRIGNETRWLEKARIIQIFKDYRDPLLGHGWKDLEFTEEYFL